MRTIKLLKRAEIELFDACDWYEKKQKGLSIKLRKEFKAALRIISLNPKLYAQKYNTELHFAPLDKFPFVVVYWYDQNLDTIFITSFFHTKREPKRFE